MAGHSKWSTIKRKKGKNDAERAKIFTKIGREIVVAVREGGGDAGANPRLRDLVAKARANNVPSENIDRLIGKVLGGENKASYETCVYEGYGPCGAAMYIECLTDNRNRTAGEIRHLLDKYGGNLGTTGCVDFLFAAKGVIMIEGGADEGKLLEDAIDAGAQDLESGDDGVSVIITQPEEVGRVKAELAERGYAVESCEIERVPASYVNITGEEHVARMNRLLELLDDFDDVRGIWHNGLIDAGPL